MRSTAISAATPSGDDMGDAFRAAPQAAFLAAAAHQAVDRCPAI
jgi:hypothetical protein